jgi:hypothetical protein
VLRTRAKLTVMRVCSNIDQYVRCLEEWQKVVAAAAADALELFCRRLLNEPRTMTDAWRSDMC